MRVMKYTLSVRISGWPALLLKGEYNVNCLVFNFVFTATSTYTTAVKTKAHIFINTCIV